MEPYDLNDLQEFRFSFLAGQRVKIRDVNREETVVRIKNEIASDYEPFVARVMEDHAVQITPTTDSLMRLSAVLPAYYLRAGKTLAAVNGQTGKVAVREAKDRFLLPWQIRPILWTAAVSLLVYCIAWLFGARQETRLIFAGCMAVFLLITLFAAYDNFYGGEKRFRQLRRIFTSDKTKKTVDAPEFYEVIDGKPVPVELRFTTVPRMARMVLIALAVVFLPLILAFILNGFSAKGLTVGGAAVWLCITVPVAPVYFLNFGRLALYEHPLIWIKKEDGTRVRYHENKQTVQDVLNTAKELVNPATLLILAAVIGVLIINVVLVLHWDQF